jgi:Leucine-rich repeat (LRR) protein
VLNLSYNKITDPSLVGGKSYQLMELNSLELAGNRIKQITEFLGFPQVHDVILTSNPLSRIHPRAFKENTELWSLNLEQCRFKSHPEDFRFLKHIPNLTSLNISKAMVNFDMENLDRMPVMDELSNLQMRDVGLIWLNDIASKF